jgi:hypothetical protein
MRDVRETLLSTRFTQATLRRLCVAHNGAPLTGIIAAAASAVIGCEPGREGDLRPVGAAANRYGAPAAAHARCRAGARDNLGFDGLAGTAAAADFGPQPEIHRVDPKYRSTLRVL